MTPDWIVTQKKLNLLFAEYFNDGTGGGGGIWHKKSYQNIEQHVGWLGTQDFFKCQNTQNSIGYAHIKG